MNKEDKMGKDEELIEKQKSYLSERQGEFKDVEHCPAFGIWFDAKAVECQGCKNRYPHYYKCCAEFFVENTAEKQDRKLIPGEGRDDGVTEVPEEIAEQIKECGDFSSETQEVIHESKFVPTPVVRVIELNEKAGQTWKEGSSAQIVYETILEFGEKTFTTKDVAGAIEGKIDTKNALARARKIVHEAVRRGLIKCIDAGRGIYANLGGDNGK